MSSVARRVATGSVLAVAVALLFVADRHAPAGLVPWFTGAALACGCAWELSRMGRLAGRGLGASLGVPTALLCLAGLWVVLRPGGWPSRTPALVLYAGAAALAAVLCLAVHAWQRRRGADLAPLGQAVGLAVWFLPALLALALVDGEWGTRGLVALVVLSKVGDVFGYFVGRAIGRRRPFPRISPNKTVAGCVASLAAGGAAGLGAVAGGLLAPGPWGRLGALAGGVVFNLAAQAGDLAESALKRRAGVKDSSTLLGPSGGVLDVVDSMLYTVPTAVVAWPLFFR